MTVNPLFLFFFISGLFEYLEGVFPEKKPWEKTERPQQILSLCQIPAAVEARSYRQETRGFFVLEQAVHQSKERKGGK